jgi:DNA mismatch repair protein MutS
VQVARLAGLPAAVVERAREVLGELEQGETTGKAARLVDDLPLFNVQARATPAKPAGADKLLQALSGINPDEMTPREALDALYRLKAEVETKA